MAVTLTSELTDRNATGHFSMVNMHIHHVQFDTQASDGVITGHVLRAGGPAVQDRWTRS